VIIAVIKKFDDDGASQLAALLTYYGFLSIFPLLLVLLTVLGLVAAGNHALLDRVHSALSRFPVIGSDLVPSIHSLHRNSPVTLAIGLAGLLWGSLGASQQCQNAMALVWNIPKAQRPGLVPRVARGLLLLVALVAFVAISSVLTGLAVAGHASSLSRAGGAGASLLVNLLLFVVFFRILTPRQIQLRLLVPGALVGGVAWSALQDTGGYLVSHLLRNTTQVYGFFAVVLGLLWWMYVVARAVLLATELNVVLARGMWPRSLVTQPEPQSDEDTSDEPRAG
jgi:YihY family inner membrane protein